MVTCEWELSVSAFAPHISFYLQQFDSDYKHTGESYTRESERSVLQILVTSWLTFLSCANCTSSALNKVYQCTVKCCIFILYCDMILANASSSGAFLHQVAWKGALQKQSGYTAMDGRHNIFAVFLAANGGFCKTAAQLGVIVHQTQQNFDDRGQIQASGLLARFSFSAWP